MPRDYSENILVQESAVDLLHEELGWESVFAYNEEVLGENGTLGRSSYQEVILYRYLRNAIRDLNPWVSDTQMAEVIRLLDEHMSTATLLQVNEEKYDMIRNGVPIMVRTPDGREDEKRVQLINFKEPANNDFRAVQELWIYDEQGIYHKRPDIMGFVNGLPLLFIELKATDVDVEEAYNKNYSDYQDTIPHLFYYNAFAMFSNGGEARIGTLGSPYKFFHEWKRLREDDAGDVALETMLRGICKKENFLDLFKNFILFDRTKGKLKKVMARNHQFLGVREAVRAYKERQLRDGKLGVFWHTQGAGKSYSMVFFSRIIREEFEGSPTIVVLTDRDDLNKQISETFEGCGVLGKVKATQFYPQNGENLVKMLKGNPSFIFTLIQKFNRPDEEPIYPEHDIILISDEAHRTQNGIFADNMMALLPTASRLGFTGTPLLSNDNITERTFGGYVSIYDFQRAVEDHATVPLYYENRGERFQEIQNPEITDRIAEAIAEADLDADQEEKVEQEFKKEIHLLMDEKRLKTYAKDFVSHYSDLWTTGKAMYVCLNRYTCVMMYDYVKKYWAEATLALEAQIMAMEPGEEREKLERKLEWMRKTDMAVVVSSEQNEISRFKKWNLDIVPHRTRMSKEKLEDKFKDEDDPLRVVFVCAMWLTGFDVPSLSCLYLDKPMKAHTLMQTIARANRVNEGKDNGLIIDYIGVVKALRKALADYTANKNGEGPDSPTVDKEKLIARIREIIETTDGFLSARQFSLQSLVDAVKRDKLRLLLDAAEKVSGTAEERREFQTLASELKRLVKYANKEELTKEEIDRKNAIVAIYSQLQRKKKSADITDLMVAVHGIINEYVTIEETGEETEAKRFDISAIDFDLLRKEFENAKHKKLIMKDLEELVKQRINNMLLRNPGRVDFYERYQEIIEEYNREQDRAVIEKTFMELMKLTKDMTEEEKRYAREGFTSDEELTIFDLLFSDDLTKQEIQKIKEVASELLEKVKKKISELDHWTDKQETRAQVDTLIRDTLYADMPESISEEQLSSYRHKVYTYMYTHYKEVA